MMMTTQESESQNTQCTPNPVVPLPIVLYDSNGLLFELYDGGQPYRSFAIRWETLKPIRVTEKGDGDKLQSSHTSHTSQPA